MAEIACKIGKKRRPSCLERHKSLDLSGLYTGSATSELFFRSSHFVPVFSLPEQGYDVGYDHAHGETADVRRPVDPRQYGHDDQREQRTVEILKRAEAVVAHDDKDVCAEKTADRS